MSVTEMTHRAGGGGHLVSHDMPQYVSLWGVRKCRRYSESASRAPAGDRSPLISCPGPQSHHCPNPPGRAQFPGAVNDIGPAWFAVQSRIRPTMKPRCSRPGKCTRPFSPSDPPSPACHGRVSPAIFPVRAAPPLLQSVIARSRDRHSGQAWQYTAASITSVFIRHRPFPGAGTILPAGKPSAAHAQIHWLFSHRAPRDRQMLRQHPLHFVALWLRVRPLSSEPCAGKGRLRSRVGLYNPGNHLLALKDYHRPQRV
jgi:hypothetical protein